MPLDNIHTCWFTARDKIKCFGYQVAAICILLYGSCLLHMSIIEFIFVAIICLKYLVNITGKCK